MRRFAVTCKRIDQQIDRVYDAHLPKNRLLDQFPVADKIVTDRMQKYVLGFSDDALKGVIGKAETKTNENDYFAAAIYHVCSISLSDVLVWISSTTLTREATSFILMKAM